MSSATSPSGTDLHAQREAAARDRKLLATAAELFRRYPRQSAVVVLLTFLAGLSEAVGIAALLPLLSLVTDEQEDLPYVSDLTSQAFDALGLTPSAGLLLAVICILIALKGALRFTALRRAGYAAAMVERDLRLELIRALMEARWSYFTNQPLGSISNTISSEAVRARQVFTKSVELLSKVLGILIYLGVALAVSWEVALLSILFGATMAIALRFLIRLTRQAGRAETAFLKSLTARLSNGLYALKPLKAMGKEDELQPRLEDEVEELHGAARRQSLSWAAMESVHEPIATVFIALTIFVMFVALSFPFSQVLFIAFLLYRTTLYMGGLQKGVQSFYRYESAYWSIRERIDQAVSEAESLPATGSSLELSKRIQFCEVSFAYGDAPVLANTSIDIPARQITAFIGPSGVGKTTIADLVVSLYAPDAGEILVDDVPLRLGNIREWRSRIGYVPQELILFHDSIFANVALGDASIGRLDVENALREAGAWEFVSALPEGVESIVGEQGMRLSGGQRQRLAIARALARSPQLLILDEATTALDPATERAILDTVARLRDRMTIVAISHQAGVVEAADVVYVLAATPSGALVQRTDQPLQAISDRQDSDV